MPQTIPLTATSSQSSPTTPTLTRSPTQQPTPLQKLFFRPGTGPGTGSGEEGSIGTGEESVAVMGTDSPLIVITPKHTITAGMSRVSTYNSFAGQNFSRQDSTRYNFFNLS